MAGETLFGQGINVAAFLDPMIMDVARAKIVVLNFVRRVAFERPSDSMKVRQRGTLTATTAAEATDHATSQYSQSLLATLQVQQVKVYSELSKKGQNFSAITVEEIAEEAGLAIVQKVEQDTLGLFDGFSKQVGTTGTPLTPQTLRRALYNLELDDIPGPHIIVLHPTQVDDVLDAIQTAGAASWGNPNVDFSLINGRSVAENGFKGTYLEAPVYQTTNVEGINADADWCGAALNPTRAIAFGEDGRGVESDTDKNLKKGVIEISADLFYDVKEAEDKAGVGIVSGQ